VEGDAAEAEVDHGGEGFHAAIAVAAPLDEPDAAVDAFGRHRHAKRWLAVRYNSFAGFRRSSKTVESLQTVPATSTVVPLGSARSTGGPRGPDPDHDTGRGEAHLLHRRPRDAQEPIACRSNAHLRGLPFGCLGGPEPNEASPHVRNIQATPAPATSQQPQPNRGTQPPPEPTEICVGEHMFAPCAIVAPMFEHHCVDCRSPVVFPTRPGETTCFGCGVRLYLSERGGPAPYPPEGWRPRRFSAVRS